MFCFCMLPVFSLLFCLCLCWNYRRGFCLRMSPSLVNNMPRSTEAQPRSLYTWLCFLFTALKLLSTYSRKCRLPADYFRTEDVLTTHHYVSTSTIKLTFRVSSSSVTYHRQDAAKRQTAGIVFTPRPIISIFAPQGRLVAPIHVKFGTTNGHVGLLGCTKFHSNPFTGVGTQPPKWQKFPLFGK